MTTEKDTTTDSIVEATPTGRILPYAEVESREPLEAQEEPNIDQIVKDNIKKFISEKNFFLIINLNNAILGSFRTQKAVVQYWNDLLKNPGKLVEGVDISNLSQYSETDQSRIEEILQDITNFEAHPEYLMAYAMGEALHNIDERQSRNLIYESYANAKRNKIKHACNELQNKLGLDGIFNLWEAAQESKVNGPVSMHNKFISQMPLAEVTLTDEEDVLINPEEIIGFANPEEINPSREKSM